MDRNVKRRDPHNSHATLFLANGVHRVSDPGPLDEQGVRSGASESFLVERQPIRHTFKFWHFDA